MNSLHVKIDSETSKRLELEKIVKQADAHINTQTKKYELNVIVIETKEKIIQELKTNKKNNELKNLNMTREHITNSNSLTEWKRKYKILQETHQHMVQQHREEQGRTKNQLSQLGIAMGEYKIIFFSRILLKKNKNKKLKCVL